MKLSAKLKATPVLIRTGLSQALARILLLSLIGTVSAHASDSSQFRLYDMTGLSYLPPSLQEKGFETLPVFFMCHMWNGRFGSVPTNCDGYDFSTLNAAVIRQRAEESLGAPLVVIDIERTGNPTSEVWHMVSEDLEQTRTAINMWREMIDIFREVNPDTKIMIYKPIQRIWWPMAKNRRYPMLKRGQAEIDARRASAMTVKSLFEDKTLEAWQSAYITNTQEEILRDERQWLIEICKEEFKTRCIFALTPFYLKKTKPDGSPLPVATDVLYQAMRELKEGGADGVGFWMPRQYDNRRYLKRVRDWQPDDTEPDPMVQWLTAVDRILSEGQ